MLALQSGRTFRSSNPDGSTVYTVSIANRVWLRRVSERQSALGNCTEILVDKLSPGKRPRMADVYDKERGRISSFV